MALSKFFSHSKYVQNTNEHYLVQSMVDESIKNFGIDVQYLPRTQNNIDTIWQHSGERNQCIISH